MKQITLEDLKALKMWINWSYETTAEGKKTKVPYSFMGKKTGVSEGFSDSWCTYETAKVQVEDNSANGIGLILKNLVFDDNSGKTTLALAGIDIDNRNLDDFIVQDIVGSMDTYTELSPSGKGIHLLCLVDKNKLPANYKEMYYQKNAYNGVECYISGFTNRFLTFTENIVKDKPICERTDKLLSILNTYMHRNTDYSNPTDLVETTNAPAGETVENKAPITNNPVPTDNRVLFDVISKTNLSGKFNKLFYEGDISDYNGDDSGADIGLANIIAFYVGNDPVRIENLMRQSALYREKWERKDYMEYTIKKALLGRNNEFFDWRNDDLQEQISQKSKITTLTAEEIMELEIEPLEPVIENMIYPGFSILAGAPKVGKSWACLDMCISICRGEPFIQFNTTQSEVVYLALEDTVARLQTRLRAILGNSKAPKGFHISTFCGNLDTGILSELQAVVNENRNIRLIIIDTLAKVRKTSIGKTTNLYEQDYKEIGLLKKFADTNKIAVLVVHHLRKNRDTTDAFNNISGSTGITGSADSMIVLEKMADSDKNVMMSITGRDFESTQHIISFNKNTYKWQLLSQNADLDEYQKEIDYRKNQIVITINHLLESDEYKGELRIKATELLEKIKEITGVYPRQNTPNTLSRFINKNLQYDLYKYDKIYYAPSTSDGGKNGRDLYFTKKLDTIDEEVYSEETNSEE